MDIVHFNELAVQCSQILVVIDKFISHDFQMFLLIFQLHIVVVDLPQLYMLVVAHDLPKVSHIFLKILLHAVPRNYPSSNFGCIPLILIIHFDHTSHMD